MAKWTHSSLNYYADLEKLSQQGMFSLSYNNDGMNKLDKYRFAGSVLVDLSNAYMYLRHDIEITSFEAYSLCESI